MELEVEGLLGVGAGGFVSSSSSDSSSVLSNIESEREIVVLLFAFLNRVVLYSCRKVSIKAMLTQSANLNH